MSFASSSAASGGKFRLRARMRTLGRGATSNGFGPQNGETQHQGEPCFSLALVDEDDEGAQQQARRAGKNGTHDEIILHREHLTDTANETKTHQRKGQLSRKRTRRTADLQPSDASLRFKTLDALYKFIELSCPGTPSLQDAAKVDFFVDVDALGLDTQRAFAFLELTDHRHKIAEHLLRITSANWLPVVSDKNFCAVLQRWLLNAPNRRAAKLRAAFTQIDRFLLGKGKLRYAVLRLNAGETHFQADPSQQLQDVRDHHAQGLHELWELALHAENHASFSDERLEQILTFLERAERNHPTQAIAAGALQALALTTTGTYQRLKQLEAPQRAFHVIHNNISNLVSYPPPQAALLLLRMLAHFASDPMCIAPALDQLGFFAACVQSGASPEICEAILGVYLPILNVSAALSATVADEAKPAHNAGTGAGDYPTVSAPCELQSYSCTELTRELSSSRRRRTKRKRASSVKSVTIGNARASTAALGEFLREITQRAATPACTDVACKLGAAVLVAQIAHGAELQDKLCCAKKCTGRVHIQTKHDPNTLPILHPLRDFLLASKVVPSGVVGLGRWALAKIARRVEARVSHFAPSLRRLRDLVLGTEAHSLDASSAGEGTFHRVGSQASIASASIAVAGLGDEPRSFSSKPETSIPAKGYLGEVYGETNELSASKGIQWMSYETKDHLPNSTDAYVLEVIFHVINSCSAWSIAMNKQCVSSRDLFVRCKTHASSVQDRELDAVFNFLAHFLGFGHEGWLRLYLVETSQHCPKTQHRLEEALCLAAIATERLLDVPQIAARLLRRGTSAAVSDVAQSHETHEDASRLLNSFRRRATFKLKSARRVCRDDADAEVNARNQLFSNGKCGKLSVQDDIALHRVNVPQPQASPFPYWPALPVLTPIAVQNATSAAVEESMARSLINLLAKTQQGHVLVDSNGGLPMLLSHLTTCRSSWQFARSKTTHVLLAGAVMLFTFGPVLPDANADTVDLNRPLEALPKNTLQQPSAPASPALAAVAARKSDIVAAATATSALSAAATGSGSGTGTSDVSAFLEAALKSRAPSSPQKPSMSKKPLSPDASQRPAATSAVVPEAKLDVASDALTSNNHLKPVSSDVISTLIYQLATFAANDELHFAKCVSSLAMATWCLARHQENATLFISQQNAVGTLLGIIHRAVSDIAKAGPEVAERSLARLENIEASLSALWLLVFQGDTLRQASVRASLFEELLLHRAVQTACDIVDTIVAARERCGRVARQSLQPAGPAKDIMQRIALQALNLLWLTVDFSPVLLTIPAKPANAFMLDILYKCSYSRAMCPQVRERSTNLLAHLAHRIRTLKDPRVITQRGVLKQKLRASNLLKLAIQHLDEDTEVLRTTGATLMARLPLSEEHQQLLKNSGRATQLLELATESSHKERRAALLALLKYAESDVGQKEIAKLGFYRLVVGCWVAADSQTPDLQDLLSALLQLLAENTANRPKIYQAELRAKEISGWAALSDADWQATLAQATEEDDRSDVGSARIAKAATNSRRDVRCAFTRWLAELESSLREDASNNLLPRASRSSSDRESQGTMRQSGRGPCPKEEDDLCKAMSAFRAHRLVLETSPQRITSPDRSLLWPFRSIIFAPNASPLNAAPSKSQGAKSALRANDHLARDMTSSLIPYERDNANPESFDEEHDLEMQFRLAKERAWARTNKTDTRGSPTAWSPGANSAARVKTSAARTPKPTPPKSTKRPFAAAGSPLLLPPWKSSSIGPDEKSGNRVWFHETVAGPTNRHSRFTAFSRAQFAAANEKLHHRLRSPVKSLWQEADQAAKLSVDPWAPNIKDIGVTSVTVERESFCFAPAGSEVAAAQETPAQFVARALQHPRNSQRLKRDKMALFGHVEGARVHEELTLYEAPEGRRGYVFYNGPRNIIDLYLDFDKLGAPPSPHDLIHLGRIDVDASLQHDENEDDVKCAVDVHLSARQILDALPGLPDGGSGMLVDTRSLVGKLEPKVFQKIQQPEPPQVYSQNHEDGARIPPPVLGEPLKELAHLERGQAETGVCWTPNGCVLDDTLPFAIRVPGRIVRLIEGAQEEDEGPQLCVEAFDGRRAFLDENPIAKACASVDWELNMKKKGFRDFLDHFDPEDAEIARDLLIGASPLLLSIYRFYCALTPQNPFAMLPPSFLRLLTDIHVLEKKGSTFTHDCMNIFIRVASMVPDDKDAKVRRLNEQCDPLSLKRCRRLMRHEFLDVILRIAHAKYCSSENPSIAAALDHFIQVHVVRYLGPETVLDFDSWRVRYLYTEDVSAVIQAHRSMLIQWFTEMAGTTQRSSRWGGLEKERLAIQEWNQGLRNLGLFTANFTIRESTFAFVLSTTNVVNWVAEWEPMIALSYQDFLEALGRVAELISIPTPEQLEFFGVETIVEFYSLMERTNLWSALDHSSTQAQTRLKIWQKSSDEDGADDSTAEEGTKTDERSLSEKLTLLLELLESRNSIDARREAELSFWISKKKRRSSQDRTVLANNDSHHDNTHEEHAGPTQESELDSDGEVDDAKTSSTKSSTGRRRRSSATELFTLDEEEMAELDEEDVTAVSDDLETFEISTATKLHEMWRSKRARLSDGRFEPRIKVINNTEYDIANLEFHQLPDYFKLENLLASHAACESIRRCWNQTMGDTRAERLRNLRKTLKTPNFIEKASAEQHDNWLKRNGKLPWVTDEQRGRYEDLSEGEKQKDRDIVLVGIEVYLETQFSDEKAV